MSEKPISPLSQRMLEDMNMRRFVPDTQREYIRAVKRLAIFLGHSPGTATAEELRAFQLHLTETGVQPPSIKRHRRHLISRAFLHWRLSDDGPGASRIVAMGHHPKPFTN
jgi:hypothetical protein